jgi:glycine/D-amino acid oxidase-like deaminating enzyme
MAMTPDHYPRLHELAPGLLAGYGYNGRGIVMATTMGRELAARAAGARLEDLVIPATPLRRIGVHAMRRPIVYGLLKYYRFRDYLDRRSDRSGR